ncbi:unnamed protein product [Linum trigynum]|uniref:Uncharacterized protein n=1 Tax=Linum trigynum TaxID=586398 RepID=A0AAV2EW73_9ROSI
MITVGNKGREAEDQDCNFQCDDHDREDGGLRGELLEQPTRKEEKVLIVDSLPSSSELAKNIVATDHVS